MASCVFLRLYAIVCQLAEVQYTMSFNREDRRP